MFTCISCVHKDSCTYLHAGEIFSKICGETMDLLLPCFSSDGNLVTYFLIWNLVVINITWMVALVGSMLEREYCYTPMFWMFCICSDATSTFG